MGRKVGGCWLVALRIRAWRKTKKGDRAEAKRKIHQIYHQCEIVDCQEVAPTLKKEGLDLEDVISLITRQDDEADRR